jgi:hypothetical protein
MRMLHYNKTKRQEMEFQNRIVKLNLYKLKINKLYNNPTTRNNMATINKIDYLQTKIRLIEKFL